MINFLSMYEKCLYSQNLPSFRKYNPNEDGYTRVKNEEIPTIFSELHKNFISRITNQNKFIHYKSSI